MNAYFITFGLITAATKASKVIKVLNIYIAEMKTKRIAKNHVIDRDPTMDLIFTAIVLEENNISSIIISSIRLVTVTTANWGKLIPRRCKVAVTQVLRAAAFISEQTEELI